MATLAGFPCAPFATIQAGPPQTMEVQLRTDNDVKIDASYVHEDDLPVTLVTRGVSMGRLDTDD